MWIELHPYLAVYLLGSILVMMLSFFKIGLFSSIDWIIKANILNKNLRKIMPPNKKTFVQKTLVFVGILTTEMLLSWINVLAILWQIVSGVLRVARDLLASTPEEIKMLRFPLRNNPNMDREAVWAYLTALKLKTGIQAPSVYQFVESLGEVSEHYPRFDSSAALKKLANLKAIDDETLIRGTEILKTERSNLEEP